MLNSHRSLKERILRASAVQGHTGVANPLLLPQPTSRPSKYKAWSDASLHEAVTAVQQQKLSIRRAAMEFEIPKSTIHDRISGRVPFGSRSGPERYLTDQEECELVNFNFLTGCASVGYAKSRHQVLALVEQVMQKGKTVTFSRLVVVI